MRGLLRGTDDVPPKLTVVFWRIVGDGFGAGVIRPDAERRLEMALVDAKGPLFLCSEDFAPVRLGAEATGPGVIDAGEIRLVPAAACAGTFST